MAINFNTNLTNMTGQIGRINGGSGAGQAEKSTSKSFGNAVKDYLGNVNENQQQSDQSITDLLAGKNKDINSVVAAVAKADSSYNVLVGVRNKLIEAYKETMRMQI